MMPENGPSIVAGGGGKPPGGPADDTLGVKRVPVRVFMWHAMWGGVLLYPSAGPCLHARRCLSVWHSMVYRLSTTAQQTMLTLSRPRRNAVTQPFGFGVDARSAVVN